MLLWRYRAFYGSCLAAFTGGHLLNYAVIQYAQEVIGSDWLAGLGFGLCFGPPLLLGWYAGVLCDRLAPGRLIHGAQALFALAALALWAAHAGIGEPGDRVPWLLAAAALAGVGWSAVAPARMAALAQVVRAQELKPASVAFNLFVMLGFGLGPLALALARAWGGWDAAFAAAVLLFALASAWLLAVPTRASGRAHAPLRKEIGEALATVKARPLLRQLLVAAMTGYLAMGPMTVLLPRLAAGPLALGELQRGLFLGSLALSLIVGGVLAMALAPRVHHGRAVLGLTTAAGLALAALGGARDVQLALALLAVVGACGGMALSLIVAGVQAEAPPAQRGRIVSLYTIISQVVPAAAGVAAGAMAQAWGAGMALHLCGAALALAMLAHIGWMRALRSHAG